MELLSGDRFPFLDCAGTLRDARALSLLDRQYFLKLRSLALELAAGEDLRSLYDTRKGFAQIIDACLLLCGILPYWVDAGMACRLLFGMGDEPPILMTFNFPDRPSSDGTPIPDEYDPEAYGVASLWSATNDLEAALRIARSEPWTLLGEILRSRAHQIKLSDPKHKDDAAVQQAGERMQDLSKSGKLQDILNMVNDA